MLDRIRNEPVLATSLVGAVIALLVAFKVPVTDAQATAILGVTGAALALVARSRVTPVE